MIITLFGGVMVKPGKEDEEARMTAKLDPVLRAMPGFISYKNYQSDDGEELGVIKFETRDALDGWVHQGVHGSAQAIASEIYERFWVQTSETYREYTWENGKRTEADLTHLFIEG